MSTQDPSPVRDEAHPAGEADQTPAAGVEGSWLEQVGLSPRTRARLVRGVLLGIGVLVVAAVVLFVDWGRVVENFFQLDVARQMFPLVITRAARNTLIFTFFGFSFGLALGLILALMRLSTIRPYRWVAATYIEIFRGLPALVTIFLIGFAIPIAFGEGLPGTYTDGSVALGLVAAAYMAETIRAGIQAVPKGQMEAARSLGMGYARSMRSIVIPQAFRIIIPPLTNELVLLLKDTSLLFVLGTTAQTEELVKFGRDELFATSNSTPLIVIGLVYLAITLPMTRLVAVLERNARKAK
jgi:polar amino acid transport system permease protein